MLQLKDFRVKWRWVFASFLAIGLVTAHQFWKAASYDGGQQAVAPFRIAGNLYYVGANDVTAFLITGPQGHVLIDGGYPGTARLIIASIKKLGFRIEDVRLLLNSHGHFDHAGGLAELKRASGAQLWVSEGDADAVESGGAADQSSGPLRFLAASGLLAFPGAKVDRRIADGAIASVGPVKLTAHITPGHTRGCTSWSFPVRDAGRDLLAVNICSLSPSPFEPIGRRGDYPGVKQAFGQSLGRLKALQADIYLTPHARDFGRWRKLQERQAGTDPAKPFIDPEGYQAALAKAETKFARYLNEQLN
ncbi:CAU/MBL1b family subclass B3 metallo-beta-lactamase [Sphingomonas swuensis]|uniref:CAU/MBL1b family subclass B3 metallo-beta-lactamase n=1 Tax=Sphingomonas swuensis TaxID=977800 RepID=A0ABP7T6L7_9SPHN